MKKSKEIKQGTRVYGVTYYEVARVIEGSYVGKRPMSEYETISINKGELVEVPELFTDSNEALKIAYKYNLSIIDRQKNDLFREMEKINTDIEIFKVRVSRLEEYNRRSFIKKLFGFN